MGDDFILCYFCATSSIQESWTHVDFTSTKKINVVHTNYFHANFPPTLIGLVSALTDSPCSLLQFTLWREEERESYEGFGFL